MFVVARNYHSLQGAYALAIMDCSITLYNCTDENLEVIQTENYADCYSLYPIVPNSWNCITQEATPPAYLATVSAEFASGSAKAFSDAVSIISIGFAMVIIALGVLTAMRYAGGKRI